MEKLLEFKDQNNNYEVYLEGTSLQFLKNGKDIDNEQEKTLVNQILMKMLPTEKIKNFGKTYYQGNWYAHKYDEVNKWHLFYDAKGKLVENISLNYIYNNQEAWVYEKFKEKSLKDKIKRIVWIADKVFLVTAYSTVLLFAFAHKQAIISNIDTYVIEPAQARLAEVMDVEVPPSTISEEEIINLINNNPNLNDSEKAYLSSFRDFFTDQIPYIDEEDLKDNLTHMYTTYCNEYNSDCKASWTYTGLDIYNIKIYESVSTDTYLDPNDRPTLRHEFFHTFSQKREMLHNLGDYFYEYVNSTMANEYAYVSTDSPDYDWGYENNLGKVMLELFSKDAICKFHAHKDCNALVSELCQIMPGEEKGYQLINYFDEYYMKINALNRMNVDDVGYNDAYDEYIAALNNLKSLLKVYYEVKNNCSITDNLYVYYYFDPIACEEKIASLYPNLQIYFVNPMDRGYINNRISSDYVINLFAGNGDVSNLSECVDIFINEHGEVLDNPILTGESIGSSFKK